MFHNNNSQHYAQICQLLGYKFKDKSLLLQALTRRSGIEEGKQNKEIGDFQRLEFLGDKVIALAIGDLLFEAYPTWKEGELTQEVAKYVNNSGPLSIIARNLGLNKMLIMGHGEAANQVQENTKVLSDATEALFGAVFIDSGKNYQLIGRLVKKHWKPLGLLQKKALSLKNQNKLNNSLLDAIKCNDESLTTELLELGADPNAIVNTIDPNGIIDLSDYPEKLSFLQFAINEVKSVNIIKTLLRYGANPDWQGGSAFIDSTPLQPSFSIMALDIKYPDDENKYRNELFNWKQSYLAGSILFIFSPNKNKWDAYLLVERSSKFMYRVSKLIRREITENSVFGLELRKITKDNVLAYEKTYLYTLLSKYPLFENYTPTQLSKDESDILDLEKIIQHLREAPKRLRKINHQKTALHFLIEATEYEESKAIEIAKTLLKFDANPLLKDYQGNTPFDTANQSLPPPLVLIEFLHDKSTTEGKLEIEPQQAESKSIRM